MKVLIAIPHIFDPKARESKYSSQSIEKEATKRNALKLATIETFCVIIKNFLFTHHWVTEEKL